MSNKYEAISEYEVRQRLSDLGIALIEGNGHRRYIEVPYETLLEIFKKKHWIHELDEFEDETEPIDDVKILREAYPEKLEEEKKEKTLTLTDSKIMQKGLRRLEKLESKRKRKEVKIANEVATFMLEIED